jgi:hypothetical protein
MKRLLRPILLAVILGVALTTLGQIMANAGDNQADDAFAASAEAGDSAGLIDFPTFEFPTFEIPTLTPTPTPAFTCPPICVPIDPCPPICFPVDPICPPNCVKPPIDATDTPTPSGVTPAPEDTDTPTPPAPGLTDTPAPTNTSAPGGLIGDVDCNGMVNAIDSAYILQFIAGMIEALPCPDNADVNEDGSVNAVDATLILQFTAGFFGSLPV